MGRKNEWCAKFRFGVNMRAAMLDFSSKEFFKIFINGLFSHQSLQLETWRLPSVKYNKTDVPNFPMLLLVHRHRRTGRWEIRSPFQSKFYVQFRKKFPIFLHFQILTHKREKHTKICGISIKIGNIIDKKPDFAFWLPYMAFASNVAYHVWILAGNRPISIPMLFPSLPSNIY